MIRFLARWWARRKYIWVKEMEASSNEWSAKVAERNASMTRVLIAQLTKEAEDMDARIKQVAEMEEKGFWLCENGHEKQINFDDAPAETQKCDECGKIGMKYVSRATMSGQEKYESDKDRRDAEKLAAAKPAAVAEQEANLENQEKTAKYFRGQAESGRKLADSLRKV